MNGIYKVDYIPEIIYTTKIEHKFNDYFYSKVSSDKSLISVFFNNRLDNVRTPENYVINSYGIFYNSDREVISEEKAKEILWNIGSVVVKPTTDSSSGQNVLILDINNGVDDSGNLGEFAYRLGYGDSDEKFSQHPDTKVVFKDCKLSFIEALIEDAKKLHGLLSDIKIISWDFTVDENGNFVVVEVNLRGQSVWFPQMISGRAIFGNNTEAFLKMLNK